MKKLMLLVAIILLSAGFLLAMSNRGPDERRGNDDANQVYPYEPGNEPNKPFEPNIPGSEPNQPGMEPNIPIEEPNQPPFEPNIPTDEPNVPGFGDVNQPGIIDSERQGTSERLRDDTFRESERPTDDSFRTPERPGETPGTERPQSPGSGSGDSGGG